MDLAVSLCKIFIERGGNKYLQLIFKVVPDVGIVVDDIEINIGKIKSSRLKDELHIISI